MINSSRSGWAASAAYLPPKQKKKQANTSGNFYEQTSSSGEMSRGSTYFFHAKKLFAYFFSVDRRVIP